MTTPATRGHMWSFDRVREALEPFGGIRPRGRDEFNARCPCHDDKQASLSVSWKPKEGGLTLLKCHGCGAATQEIVEALGLTMADLFDTPLPAKPERVGRSPQQRAAGKRRTGGRLPAKIVRKAPEPEFEHSWVEVTRYPYTDAGGRLVQEVIREECSSCALGKRHKTFRQVYVNAHKTYVKRKPDGFVPVPYRLPAVVAAATARQAVWILEGEKDVETAEQLGLVATTNAGGGLGFPESSADLFRGLHVLVVLDRDQAGWDRGVQLTSLLGDHGAASVQLLLPGTTEAKSDFTDHVEAGLWDPDQEWGGLLPVVPDEVAAHASVGALRSKADRVLEARAEAFARAELAVENDAEAPKVRSWAMEAERRFEDVLDDALLTVRRHARKAATDWAHEAVDAARGIWLEAQTAAREAYQVAGLPVPQGLYAAAEVDGGGVDARSSAAAVVAASNSGAAVPGAPVSADGTDEQPGGGPRIAVRGMAIEAPCYRLYRGKLVEVVTKEGREQVKLVLGIDARIVEMEYLEREDSALDVDRPQLFGRDLVEDQQSLNPPAPEQLSAVVIGYTHPDTGEFMRMRISAEEYRDCLWVDSLPGPPDFDSRPSGIAKLRDALKVAGGADIVRTVRYRSTGWRCDEAGDWFYVHAGGAITREGARTAPVHLTGPMTRYELPVPTGEGARIREAFLEHSGAMLSRIPCRVGAPLLGHVFRAALGPNPWLLLLVGSPGSYKTSVASLAMHHFGELWDRRHPGSSMSGNGDTLNALRIKLHAAKDSLYWADDVAPTRDWTGAQKMLEEFARLVHNGEQRSRSTRDGQGVLDGTPPRSSAIVTSEVTPRPGTSGGARTFPVPMLGDEIPLDTLIALDRDESRYGRALVMSSFIRWLADGRLHEMRELAKTETESYAQTLRAGGSAVRGSEAAGTLWSGWVVLGRFLVDVGAMSAEEVESLLDLVALGIVDAIEASTDPDMPLRTGARVRDLLAHALRTGIAYVDDVRTGGEPEWPLAGRLGWRRMNLGDSGSLLSKDSRYRLEARGIRLGYVLSDPGPRDGADAQLLVYSSALEQVLKATCQVMADAPQVDLGTAVRALYDEGVLIAELRNGRTPRYTVQRTLHCEERRQRVTALRLWQVLGEDPDDTGEPGGGPEDGGDDGGGGVALELTGLADLLGMECREAGLASESSEQMQESTTPVDDEENLVAPTRPAAQPARQQPAPQQPAARPAAQTTAPRADSNAYTPVAAAAILDADGVWLPDGTKHLVSHQLRHVGDVALLAEELNLGTPVRPGYSEAGQIWVTAAALAKLGVTLPKLSADSKKRRLELGEATVGSEFVDAALADGWQIGAPGDRLGAWNRVWRNGSKTVWVVLIPGLDDDGVTLPVMDESPAPAVLARRLDLFAKAVKFPFTITPQTTGFDLMLSTRWKDRARMFTPTTPVPPAEISSCESDISWSRKPSAAEAKLTYIHAYDRGGSHAAGMAGLELPIGPATHYPDGCAFDKKLPGYWRVEIPEAADWRFPHPLMPLGGIPRLLWVTTPSLQLAVELGYELDVAEAYVWHDHGRVLDPFYERLRDARTELDVGGEGSDTQLARDLVKAVYTRTIGQMGSFTFMKLPDGSWRRGFSPERRHHIIAKARANILRRVQQIGTDTEQWPLAIDNDLVLYASDERDPLKAWPGKPANFGRGLGQFKWEGSSLLADHLDHLTGHRYRGKEHLSREWEFES